MEEHSKSIIMNDHDPITKKDLAVGFILTILFILITGLAR